jgi:hypothetical protein
MSMPGDYAEVDFDDEPGAHPLSADEYVQPDATDLAQLRHRLHLPDLPGVSYRCPPAPRSADGDPA